jgi:mannose-6-phosphate isomerase-like protein (cupin superfamily)
MSNAVEPFVVLPGEGTLLPIPFGGSLTVKAQTRNTNGSLTVLEFVHPPKAGPAVHTHWREDELWYVLEGDYRFKVGEAMFRVSEGGMAFGPRGAPHGFQNVGDTSGRLLVIATPSGVERFFEQCAELLPGSLDAAALAAITEANWSQPVGPPLGVSDPL